MKKNMNFGDAVLAAWNSVEHEEPAKTSYEELYEGAFLPRPGAYKPLSISMPYEKWAEEMNRQGYFFNHSMPTSGKIGKKWTGKVSWYRHNMRLIYLHDSFDEISITRNIGEECVREIWCHGKPAEVENLIGRRYFAFPTQDGGLKIWHRRERCFSEHATMAEAVEALGICAECECLRRRFGCLCDEAGEPLRGEDGKRIECIEGFYCRHQCAIREAACRSR